MSNHIAIIPCRLDSSRLPKKPLKIINGYTLLQHCYNRTSLAIGKHNTFIATCDKEIQDHVNSFNGNCVMTSNTHERATTRTFEAVVNLENKLNKKLDQILMVQGDEPTIKINDLQKILKYHTKNKYGITNLVSIINDNKIFRDQNYVKVVKNNKNEIIYFSREPLPSAKLSKHKFKKYQQVGIIAFRRKELFFFNSLKQSNLEKIESIDMNRCIENNIKINSFPIHYQTYGVDTLKDLKFVKKYLLKDKDVKRYNSL